MKLKKIKNSEKDIIAKLCKSINDFHGKINKRLRVLRVPKIESDPFSKMRWTIANSKYNRKIVVIYFAKRKELNVSEYLNNGLKQHLSDLNYTINFNDIKQSKQLKNSLERFLKTG